MDANDMRRRLESYLSELNWAGGVTKEQVLAHLSKQDGTLATMVSEYIAEGTYARAGDVLTLIPTQAWQDAQGDAWRGPSTLNPEDVPSGFRQSPVGADETTPTR
jgi:hypothetical protein